MCAIISSSRHGAMPPAAQKSGINTALLVSSSTYDRTAIAAPNYAAMAVTDPVTGYAQALKDAVSNHGLSQAEVAGRLMWSQGFSQGQLDTIFMQAYGTLAPPNTVPIPFGTVPQAAPGDGQKQGVPVYQPPLTFTEALKQGIASGKITDLRDAASRLQASQNFTWDQVDAIFIEATGKPSPQTQDVQQSTIPPPTIPPPSPTESASLPRAPQTVPVTASAIAGIPPSVLYIGGGIVGLLVLAKLFR